MSNFPLTRYRATDTWIPETDVDGADANENILAEVDAVEFNNGFFENMEQLNTEPLPAVISDLIDEAADPKYELLSVKSFRHSVEGTKTVYILWADLPSTAEEPELAGDLIIYLDDSLLPINDDDDAIIFIERPHHINYNLVNDQLKINLNCKASFFGSESWGSSPILITRILNLTLLYLSTQIYSQGSFVTYSRYSGWYIRPRWLGMLGCSLDEGTLIPDTHIPFTAVGYGVTGTPLTLITGGLFNNLGWDGWLYIDDEHEFHLIAYYNISKIVISYLWVTWSPGDQIIIRGYAVDGTIYEDIMTPPFAPSKLQFTRNYTYLGVREIKISTHGGDAIIDWVDIGYNISEAWVLVAKYFDGQRALVEFRDANVEGGEIASNPILTLYKNDFDWRIVAYEFYVKEGEIFYLAADTGVTLQSWIDDTDSIYTILTLEASTTTLNLRYNLPYNAYVDNQREIYSEIMHKGRVYFIKNDYKVYQSHISTNLAVQPDVFPYDEETGFGYLIVDQSKINLALAVSPTNDMIILTNNGFYVYFLQPSGAGVFRQLRIASGSITISSINSMPVSLNGEPATDGLFWCDNNGIYIYFGGLQPPENLITGTHRKYWGSIPLSHKAEAVGFYNPAKKEYWLCLGLSGIMIFEVPFKKFRYIGITSIAEDGGLNEDGYVKLRAGSSILVMSPTVSRYNAEITTHWNTTSIKPQSIVQKPIPAPEIFHKILQEIYMEFGDSDVNVQVLVQVYVNGYFINTYIFNTNDRLNKWLSPAGLRANRIRLRIIIPSGKRVRIKEFGFSTSEDFAEPLGAHPVEVATEGYGYDYGSNYGTGL